MLDSIIYLPRDTCYLAEFINEFLRTYNTVGIQVTKDCYVLKLEQPMRSPKTQMGGE